jgi:Ca2+-binding EF-hand superfamily protein
MQQEKTMLKSTKIAIAFLAFAGTAGSLAIAADRTGGPGKWRHGMMRFDRMDKDSNGDITLDEFSAAMANRMTEADTDHDGKVTVAELAAEIEKMRAERMAKRIIDRFDTNGDGVLTKAEVESRQKKMFALLDRNDDGKIEKSEQPHHRPMQRKD